ncbi:MAG: ABC transporter ATP-binding protein [Planctomycetota bacterium]|jgi:ABC-type multidrug transport system ATPase subunit
MEERETTPNACGIEVRGFSRSFRRGFLMRQHAILDRLDLSVPRGSTFGLVGPNGSGKSTLLRAIAGVDPGDAGQVRVLDHDPRAGAVRARIGFLPEGCPYPSELGARSVLTLLDRAHGAPSDGRRERVERWLARVGLDQAGDKPIRTFSSGMRRRLGLAAACQSEPDVLLLDEPSAGLDGDGVRLLEELLEEARGRGATLLVCSHLPSDLYANCDAIAILLDGRIATVQEPSVLATRVSKLEVELERRDATSDVDVDELTRRFDSLGLDVRGARPSASGLVELYRRLASEDGDRDEA